jgi:uncharacterized protein YciI
MASFVVTTEAGPAWDPARPRREQDQWKAHAEFIDAQAAAGFILLVGPLSPTRALQVIEARNEAEVRSRLAEDPWMKTGMLRVLSLDPWEVLVGKERLVGPAR